MAWNISGIARAQTLCTLHVLVLMLVIVIDLRFFDHEQEHEHDYEATPLRQNRMTIRERV